MQTEKARVVAGRAVAGRGGRDLSIVIPIYNEIENLGPLLAAIRSALASIEIDYEVVLVDDGSTDGTREEMRRFARRDGRLVLVFLRGNFGQTAAMAAGFDVCRGRNIVTMDGDLQNDPRDIPQLLAKLDMGYDIVCGWRKDRQDRAFTRKLPSWIANKMIALMTGVSIHDTGCTLKAYRSWVVRKLHLYSDMHRFIPALASGVGASVGEIPVIHHARRYGESKYGIGRTFKVMTDMLVIRLLARFAAHPVRYFAILSIPTFLIGVALALVGLFQWRSTGLALALKWDIHYMTGALVLGMTAMNLFMLGLLAELSVNVSRFFLLAGFDVRDSEEPKALSRGKTA